jgi:hypothetical protein
LLDAAVAQDPGGAAAASARQRKLADAIGDAARAALLKTATASGTYVARETSG